MKIIAPTLFTVVFCLVANASPANRAGNLDPGFVSRVVNDGGFVFSTAVQPGGKILIGGSFRLKGETEQVNIARLNRNGSIDRTFDPGKGADETVYSIVVQPDGRILIAGDFTFVDGEPKNYVARLEPNGAVESTATFDPGTGPDEEVHCMALQADGKILIGGRFTVVNGEVRNYFARLNADGSLESTATFDAGTGADGWVLSIAIQADGRILLGGSFGRVNGQLTFAVARLHPNGNVESPATFNSDTNFGVYALALQADGKILVGGLSKRIVRLEANGSLESSATFNAEIGPSTLEVSVSSLALQTDGKILVGGIFTEVNGEPRNYFARLQTDGTLEDTTSFNAGTGPDQPGFDVALQADGRILLGGLLATVNGKPRIKIARLFNNAAKQRLSVRSRNEVRWFRTGATPEVEHVTFEVSAGRNGPWTSLGVATRIAGGWERTGLTLPARGFIRARGRTAGGIQNTSSGLVEQIASLVRARTTRNHFER